MIVYQGPTREGRTKAALRKIKDALSEGRQLIAHRQKLLKLADRLEYGWKVVDQYEDELADDSEDEKRISKVEQAAERLALAKGIREAAEKRKKAPNVRETALRELLPRKEERPYKPSAYAPGAGR